MASASLTTMRAKKIRLFAEGERPSIFPFAGHPDSTQALGRKASIRRSHETVWSNRQVAGTPPQIGRWASALSGEAYGVESVRQALMRLGSTMTSKRLSGDNKSQPTIHS